MAEAPYTTDGAQIHTTKKHLLTAAKGCISGINWAHQCVRNGWKPPPSTLLHPNPPYGEKSMSKLSSQNTQQCSRFLTALALVFTPFFCRFYTFFCGQTHIHTFGHPWPFVWTHLDPESAKTAPDNVGRLFLSSCIAVTVKPMRSFPFPTSAWIPHETHVTWLVTNLHDNLLHNWSSWPASALVTLLCSLHTLRDPPSLYQDSFRIQLLPHATEHKASSIRLRHWPLPFIA